MFSAYFKIGVIFVLFERETTNSLRLSKLVVPIQKFRGENALLECQYELNNKSVNNNYDSSKQYRRNTYMYYSNDDDEEVLYSVKWYKDGEEFYRFVPRANPQQNSYSFDGIRVDYKNSNNFRVFLKDVSLKSSGIYKCEVSLEGPSFTSVASEKFMQIVFLPSDGPFLHEDQSPQPNELNLNCTSARSFPASKLHFFHNDSPINPKYVIIYPDVYQINGLISTKIGLHMKISPQFFENGLLRIKCVAIISPFNIWSGNKETFIQQQGLQQSDIPLPSIDTREVLFSVKACAITINYNFLLNATILFLKMFFIH